MKIFLFLIPVALLSACVPKTQYDDQQAKLEDAQNKLKTFETNTAECDKDTFMQLREQAQSMELLNQELLARNTELSREMAALKVNDSQGRAENSACETRIQAKIKEFDEKLARTQATYDDLVRDLKQQIEHLKTEAKPKSKAAASPKASPHNSKPAKN